MGNQNYVNQNQPGSKMREVSLPRLLLLTFRRWRSMLLVGLILAMLLAGMKVIREYRNRGVSNVAQEEYLAAMEIYNSSVEAYSTSIEKFQTKIDSKQKYFNESLLMQLDPHNECVSSVTFVARTPGLENADKADASSASAVNASNAAHACTDFILNGISYDKIAKKYNVPEQSIRELVTVVADQYHFSSVFKVQARSMDMKMSSEIMDVIQKALEDNRDHLVKTIGEYELNVVSRSEEVVVDTVLLQQQTELQNSIATLQKNLQTSQTALKELIKPSVAAGASMKTIIKHGIKYGIVGMAGGIFLMILLYAIHILMTGKILTDDEINIAYGLRNLITMPAGNRRGKSRFPLDRLVDKLVNDAPDMSVSAAYDVLAARVENYAVPANVSSVIVAGTIEPTRLSSFTNTLNKHAKKDNSPVSYEASSNLTEDASAIRRLRQADACIVVEEIGASSFRDVSEEVEMILSSGKPILGTVYL